MLGLKPNEIAAIITGIVGMVFGLFQYRRAKRSEELALASDERAKRAEARAEIGEERAQRAEERTGRMDSEARELLFAAERQSALVSLREEEIAVDLDEWKLRIDRAAADRVNAVSLLELIDDQLSNCVVRRQPQGELRQLLENVPIKSATHNDIVLVRDKAMSMLKQFAAERKRDDAVLSELREQVQLCVKLFEDLRTKGIDPNSLVEGLSSDGSQP
jgi:hypothetical protein